MQPLLIAAVSLTLIAVACPAGAQQLWAGIEIPGGAAAARRVASLGNPDRRQDSAWLVDFARKHASSERLEANVRQLAPYLEAIEYLRQDLGQWPDGLVLPTPQTPRDERTRLETLFDSMGLSLRSQDRQYRLQLGGSDRARERRAQLMHVNVDAEKIAAQLNSGARVRVEVSSTILPLPLPDWWRTEVFPRAAAQGSFMWSGQATSVPLLAIVQSQSALFTYLGLMALDSEALKFMAERPRFVSALRDGASGAFATFSRSLRLRGGSIDVPGGPESAAIWTALTGRGPGDPEQFILSLLVADGGRLAYFYDTVASLAPTRQSFILGNHMPAADRVAFVRRIYRRFVEASPAWSVARLPFDRPAFDPAIALMFVDVLSDGTVGPSWWPGALTHVFAHDFWPGDTGYSTRSSGRAPADAAWLVEWVFADPAQASARFGVLRFAQRQFPGTDAEQLDAVEVALRARKDMPALALALERMNVRDATLVATLASAARRLTLASPHERAAQGVSRWQGALALVERVQSTGALPPSRVTRLLQTLAEMVPGAGALPSGAVAEWIADQLVPSLIEGGAIESENQFLGLVMGPPDSGEASLSWEGLRYLVRHRDVVLASAVAIRQARPGPRLHHLLQLQGARRRLEQGAPAPDAVRALAVALTALEPLMSSVPRVDDKAWVVAAEYQAAVAALHRVAASDDVAAPGRSLPPLLAALDALTDAIVPAICYALAAAPVDAPETVSEAWLLHSATSVGAVPDGRPWNETVWAVPAPQLRRQGGTAVVGALLSLDLAFASSKLVRVPSAAIPAPQLFSEIDATYLTQAVVLADASDDAPVFARAIAALKAGRGRAADWNVTPPVPGDLIAALQSSGVDPWRTNLIVWDAARGAGRVGDALSLTELFRLGGGRELPSSWMGPSRPLDGCLCRASNEPRRLDDVRGRRFGVRVAVMSDLRLRLAEVIHELALPWTLVPLLVPMATQDWLDEVEQAWMDDWEPLAHWPARMSRERVEAYLLHLVSIGTLTPPRSVGDPR